MQRLPAVVLLLVAWRSEMKSLSTLNFLIIFMILIFITGCTGGGIPTGDDIPDGGDNPGPGPNPGGDENKECEGANETEPNGTYAVADPITIGIDTYGCVVEVVDQWDFWTFTIAEDEVMTIHAFNDGAGDIDLGIYNSSYEWVDGSGDHGPGGDEWLDGISLEAGTYFITIEADYESGPYPDDRPYHILSRIHEECFHETEPNGQDDPDEFDLTYDPEIDECFTGMISRADDEDWYEFAPIDGGMVVDWQYEVIDTLSASGRSNIVDIDSNGNPHIFYCDMSTEKLKYARFDGSSWQIETLADCWFLFNAMLDSNDQPHVMYVTYDFGDLFYSYYDGSEWQTYNLDSSPGGTPGGFTLDDNDHPHLAWDGSGGNLMYATWDGVDWTQEHVYSGSAYPAINASVQMDSNGYPHIAHCQNYSPLNLYHSWKDAGGWHTGIIAHPGYEPSMRIDENDNIHIAYTNGSGAVTGTHLMYARYDGSSWAFTDVDGTSTLRHAQLALDSSNHPHISYWDDGTDDQKYAAFDGSTWTTEFVDTRDIGAYSSVTLEPDDMPRITYSETTTGDLILASRGLTELPAAYNGWLTVAMTCSDLSEGQELTISLIDGSYSTIQTKTLTSGHYAASVRVPYDAEKNQKLYIKVEGNAGGLNYDLHPLLMPNIKNDSLYETEPNNGSSSADMLALDYDPDTDGLDFTGIFAPGDTSDDWYKLETTENGILIMHIVDYDIAPGNEWVMVGLYDSTLSELDSYTILHGDGSICLETDGSVPPGTYYVKLDANTWTHRYVIEPIFMKDL